MSQPTSRVRTRQQTRSDDHQELPPTHPVDGGEEQTVASASIEAQQEDPVPNSSISSVGSNSTSAERLLPPEEVTNQRTQAILHSSASSEARQVDPAPNSSISRAGSISASSETRLPPEEEARARAQFVLPETRRDHFTYRGQDVPPIALFPGEYISRWRCHIGGELNSIAEWAAERNIALRLRPFMEEGGSTLYMSSEDDETSSAPVQSIFPRSHDEPGDDRVAQRRVHYVQLIFSVLERSERHRAKGQAWNARWALQLGRIYLHLSGASERYWNNMRQLYKAYLEGRFLPPVIELASHLLIAMKEETQSFMHEGMSMKEFFMRFIQRMERCRPYNAQEATHVDIQSTFVPSATQERPEDLAAWARWTTPRGEEPDRREGAYSHSTWAPGGASWEPTTASNLSIRDLAPQPSLSATAGARLLPARPPPIAELTTENIDRYLSAVEQYEQQYEPVPRDCIGNVEIRRTIESAWNCIPDNNRPAKTWNDAGMSWRVLLQTLREYFGNEDSLPDIKPGDPMSEFVREFGTSWVFNPTDMETIHRADGRKTTALQAVPAEARDIVARKAVRYVYDHADFTALQQRWRTSTQPVGAEVIRNRFFPTVLEGMTVDEWFTELIQRVLQSNSTWQGWRSACRVPKARLAEVWALEGKLMKDMEQLGLAAAHAQDSREQPRGKKPRHSGPAAAGTAKPQGGGATSSVEVGFVACADCPFCREQGVTTGQHKRKQCPYYEKGRFRELAKKWPKGKILSVQHMLTPHANLPVINIYLQDKTRKERVAAKALLDSGANANFIHPSIIGEDNRQLAYTLTPTNIRLDLALNAGTVQEAGKVTKLSYLGKSASALNKNSLNQPVVDKNKNSVRLLTQHLNIGEDKIQSSRHTIFLNNKTQIYLSIDTPQTEEITFECEAYVANIRYPIILGYPTLLSQDIFRRLPGVWSPMPSSPLLAVVSSGESSGSNHQDATVSNSEIVHATDGCRDCMGYACSVCEQAGHAQGSTQRPGRVTVAEVLTRKLAEYVEIYNSSALGTRAEGCETASTLCTMHLHSVDAHQSILGFGKSEEADGLRCIDDKPEGVFMANLYAQSQEERDRSHSESELTEEGQSVPGLQGVPTTSMETNFTDRSPREWEDVEDIPDNKLDAIPAELLGHTANVEQPAIERITIKGPASLKAKLRALTREYEVIFRASVTPVAAKIEPFRMKVDEGEWHVPANGFGIRRMDKTRQKALKQQIDELLRLGVIRESRAGYYSHGFLVPKKNGKWRLVIDYKKLNKATHRVGWPIPNIQDLLARIGEKRPQYFGVMDLTSGYHQAPISEECQAYTAFLTPFGLYEWVRLPMGLAGAPSYFQRVMSTDVLAGLHSVLCFLYLDDCIVTGGSEDEFVANMRRVFQRLREKGITLNPDKCVLGADEVEYVGHTINKHGLHFERSKLDSILEWPRPDNQKQLKRFLGVVNWFRDHVKNHSVIVRSLNSMLQAYDKRAKLTWTQEANDAFTEIKLRVHECPMLHFMDDTSPIYLETDASQYGMGASLYQLIEGRPQPVAFLSKAFDGRLMRWDTAQKEGYAIYYALTKWEHLLRDRKFTILTDHRNLRYLKDTYGHLGKVQRWFLCFQAYDYTLVHLPGEKNTVADGLSRCCAPPEGPDQTLLASLAAITDIRVPKEQWEMIAAVHNSSVGHFGVQRTMKILRRLGVEWENMRVHIRKFIHLCPACQKMSQLKPLIHAKAFTISAYRPMERVAIDYIHNLPVDHQECQHILVVIDCFSRFVELYPTRQLTAEETADHLLCYVGRYGPPIQILSDNGSHFVNGVITSLLHYMGIDHQFSMAYSKEENGIVERANKEVIRHLRNIMFDNGHLNQWSRYLPLVQNIMNSAVHSATGCSPAQLIFGSLIDPARGLIFPQVVDEPKRFAVSTYVSTLFRNQQKLVEAAAASLRKRDKRHMQQYAAAHADHGPLTSFEVGQYVLIEYPNIIRTGSTENKLLPVLKGPAKVIRKLDDSRYRVEDLVTRRAKDYHVSTLRPYFMDLELQKAPLFYAIRDHHDYYVVERITAHRGNPRSKSKMQFQVYWTGYEEPTWEPWNKVSKTLALYQYLRNHRNASLRKITPDLDLEEVTIPEDTSETEKGVDLKEVPLNDTFPEEDRFIL